MLKNRATRNKPRGSKNLEICGRKERESGTTWGNRKGRERHEKGTAERVSIVTTVLVVCSVEEKVYADSSAEAREKPKKEGRKEERMRTKETRKEIRVNRKEEKREKKPGDHRAWAVRAK